MNNEISIAESVRRLRAAAMHLADGLDELEASPSHLMLADVSPSTETARAYQAIGVTTRDLRGDIETISRRLNVVEQRSALSAADAVRALGERFLVASRGGKPPVTDSGAATAMMALPEAVTAVRTSLEALADFVARIDRIWLQNLGRLDAANDTLNRLDSEVEALGIVEPLLKRTGDRVAQLNKLLMTDPLAAEAGTGIEVDRLVAEAASRVASARAGRDNLDTDMAGTEVLLAGLRVLRNRAQAALDESTAKIVDPPEPVLVPSSTVLDGPQGLARQLDEINAAMGRPQASSQPDWAVHRSRLDAWLRTAGNLEAQLTEAVERNSRGLQRRDELRGAFGAYEAKMAAVGRAEDLSLTEIVDRVWSALYSAPTDLDAAESALAELADALRQP